MPPRGRGARAAASDERAPWIPHRALDRLAVAAGQDDQHRAGPRRHRSVTSASRRASPAALSASRPSRRAPRGRRRRRRRRAPAAAGPSARSRAGGEGGQVGVVAGAVGQVDVEVGGDAPNGKLRAPWTESRKPRRHRPRRSAVPSPWWTSRSTTSTRRSRPSRRRARDRQDDVVEHAVAAAEGRPSVVRAAAEVGGDAVLERRARRRHRRARRAPGPQHELGRPGQAEGAASARRAGRSGRAAGSPGRGRRRARPSRRRRLEAHAGAAPLDRLPRQPVLAGGEAVALREREA